MPPFLPDPRPDGDCVDCRRFAAVTTDGRFCRRCLTRRIAKLNRPPRDLNDPGVENLDRRRLPVSLNWIEQFAPGTDDGGDE